MEGELIREFRSEKVDYVARIYRKGGKYVVTTEWLEEEVLGEFDDLDEAIEAAKDAIQVQEEMLGVS